MASEIILTEPILRPATSFAVVRNAFESMDKRATFCLAVCSDKITVLLLNGSTQKAFGPDEQKKKRVRSYFLSILSIATAASFAVPIARITVAAPVATSPPA